MALPQLAAAATYYHLAATPGAVPTGYTLWNTCSNQTAANRAAAMATAGTRCTTTTPGNTVILTPAANATVNVVLFVATAAYTNPTNVAGNSTGNSLVVASAGNNATQRNEFQVQLGYVSGTAFTAFGTSAPFIPTSASTPLQANPDLSAVSGTVPAGAYLAVLVQAVGGATANAATVYVGQNGGTANSNSGTFNVTETPRTVVVAATTNPGASMIQNGGVAPVDAFTLTVSGGPATISSVSYSLTGNGSVSNAFVTDAATCSGGTIYGTATSPGTTGTVTTSGLSPSDGTTTLYLCVTANATAGTVTGYATTVAATGFTVSGSSSAGTTVTVTSPTVVVGAGTNPGSTTVPSGSVGALDAFTLTVAGGPATISSVSYALAGNASASNVFVHSAAACTGGTTYGTATGPGTTGTIATSGLSAANGTTTLYLCMTASSTPGDVTGYASTVAAAGFTVSGSSTAGTTLTVPVPVTGVSIAPTSATVNVNASQQFTATLSPSNATNQGVAWSVIGTNCGTVNATGLYAAPAAVASGCSVQVRTLDGNFTAAAPITLNQPVTGVAISPTSATVNVGASQQFTATVSPASATNQNVTWSVVQGATCGTVSPTGLYTAPATVTSPCTVRVTTVDGGFTADAAVTLNKPVTGVAIAPTSATVTVNGTQQFTATVSPADATNTSVTWTVVGASCGSVSGTGLYTAPATVTSPCSVQVTTVDGGFAASATVTLQAAVVAVTGVAIAPTSATVNTGATQQFTATVSPANATNPSVTWSVVQGASCGTISPTGLYTAPTNVTSPCTVRVTTVDGGFTASAAVTLEKRVTGVAIAPTIATVTVNATQQFTATVSPADATNQTVTWSVVGASCGTISPTGLYTAPPAVTSPCSVRVTTQDGGFTATAGITLQAANVAVTGVAISPTSATVDTGATQQFTATVSPANASNQNVTWAVVGTSCGAVSATGLYTAPANVAAGCSVRVTTQDGGFTASAAVTLRKPVTGVAVAPTSATVALNGTQQFTATVSPTDATNKAVSWSVVGAGCGSVSATGLYTAPAALASPCTVRVTTSEGGFIADAAVSLISGPTTIVADVANPPGGTVAPGSAARAVDAFSLQTNTGTDAVTSATVTLASGTWVGLSAVSIQDTSACTQGTPYGSIAPASNQVVVPLTGVTATGTATTYYVCVTPRAHSAMPVPPGADYAVTATVTAIASTNPKAYGDTASATITVDNKSPGNVAWGAITPTSGQVSLTWTPPADADFSTVVVLRNARAPVVDAPGEGTNPSVGTNLPNSVVVCAQAAGPCVDSPLSDGVPYYYKAFARDQNGNYSVGVAAGPAVPGPNPFPVGSSDPARPMVAIVNPGNGAVVSGGLTQPFRVQARVWSPGALVTGVRVTADGGASWTTLVQSTAYAGTPNLSGVWEGQLTLLEGSYSLVAQAKNDAATWINSVPVGVVVKPANTGDGRLLVRDNSSQLCTDCHPQKAHSSETMGTTYGSWATICRDCHTPHGTTNIYLVPTQITPPPVGAAVPTPKDVTFIDPAVLENASKTGPCQVCHTQTKFFRADGTSPGGSHYTTGCADCHKHSDGLKASCYSCHGDAAQARVLVPGADDLAMAAPPVVAPDAVTFVADGGVHLQHVNQATWRTAPLACAECHPSPNTHQGTTDVQWSTLATGGGAVAVAPAAGAISGAWATGTPSCTNYCHGASLAGGGGTVAAPAWNTPGAGGQCGDCHGSPPPVSAVATQDHPQNASCGACHGAGYTQVSLDVVAKATHIDGTLVKPANGCTACHGDLAGISGTPVASSSPAAAPGYTFGVGVDTKGNTATTSPGVGAHAKHVRTGLMAGKACGVCHGATPTDGDTSHANGTVALGFTAPADAYGATTSPAAFNSGWESSPSCTNYCHSNAAPLGGALSEVSVTWTATGGMGCTSCHGTGGAASTLSAAHRKHTDAATYGYTCEKCHASASSDGISITGPGVHVDGVKTVAFNGAPLDQTGASYRGAQSAPNYTCSNTYCHSNGVDRTAPFTSGDSVAWSSTITGCAACHPAGSAMATGSHGAHVNQASYIGTNLGCVTCHDTAASDTAIAAGKYAQHVNGQVETTGTSYSDPSSDGVANGTCASNYCHSNGTENLVSADYKPVQWGGTLANDCKGCHGTEAGSIAGAPWYANGTGSFKTRNSHQKHVASASDCASCHDQTVTAAGALIAGGTKHLDTSRDVHGPKIGGYDEATETCSAITCHSGNSAQWGGTLTCADCHVGAGDQNDWDIANGVTSRIDSTEWTTWGHGQSSFSAFSGATNRCVYCHDDQSTSAKHGQSGNPFRLRGASDATGATAAYSTASETAVVAACLNCHGVTGANGVDPDGAGGQPKVGPATARIDAIHHGAQHGATNGGQRCWDCHDAHGDQGNIKMISRDVLANATDVHGLTGTRAAAEAIFTTTGVGGYTDQTAPTYNGVCQVCHTATKYWRADGTLPHNPTQDCLSCHTHEQPPDLAFQGAGACSACHLAPAAAGNQDVDDYVYNNGTKAMVDGDDWAAYGHGATSAYAQSGNPGAAFPVNATVEGCYYCHAPDTAIPGGSGATSVHGDAANPFRLANAGGADGKNGVCLVCHKTGSAGFDPDGANGTFADGRNATKKVGAAHYGAEHTTGGKGGEFCWDCHDPHGDYNYTAGSRALAYMIQEKPVRTHVAADPNGWGIPDPATELANAVAFDKAVGGDTAALDGTDYVSAGTPTHGVCQVCHTATTYWTASGGGATHQNGAARCITCHAHDQGTVDAFKPVSPTSCSTCHPNPPNGGRHAAHLSAAPSTTYGDVTIRSTSTEYDFGCGKCHGTVASNHMDDQGGTSADPYRADVGFDLGGTYSTLAAPVASETGATTPPLYFGWQNGSCSATYCHDPLGAGYTGKTAVAWNTAATLTCAGCHDDAYNLASTALPGAHGKHSLATTSGGYAYGCEKCHANTVTDSATVSDRTFHVNGNKDDVKFNSSPVNQAAGTFSGGTAGTCSNTYCHSNGQSLTPPFTSTSTAWNLTTNCGSCHGQGGGTSTTLTPSHARHVDTVASDGYAYDCDRCHNNTGNGTTITNKANHVDADATHDVAFNALPVTQTAGTYDPATKTCSNTYCHSNGQSVTAPFTSGPSVAWGTSSTCTSCHGGGGGASTTLSARHGIHVNATASGGYAFDCARCHVNTGTASAITNKANHVDADVTTHDVAFDATLYGQNAGTYNATAQTCSNTYCHSDGQDRVAPFTSGPSISWTTAKTCGSCHAAGAALATRSHPAHVNNAAYTGNFGCATCHDTAQDDATIAPAKASQHVDFAVEVLGGYTDGTADNVANGTCSTNACHSNGTETPLVAADYKPVTWGVTTLANDCKGCHGAETTPDFTSAYGEPNYANNAASNKTRNSHKAHVTYGNVATAKTECVNCHNQTVDATGALIPAKHLDLDGVPDVSGAKIGAFDAATETCSTVACHGNGSAQWGATLDCSACHMGAQGVGADAEVDNFNYGDGTIAKLDPEDWINYGHGRPSASGAYDSGNPAAAFDTNIAVSTDDGCKYCHDKNVSHGQFGTSANPFRLANIGAGNTAALKNQVCTICHGGAGYLGKTATKAIDASHHGAKHTTTNGGELCWDCHDPHGDSRYVANNATETPAVAADEVLGHMIDAKIVRTHNTAEGNTTEWGTNGTAGPTYATSSPRFNKSLVAPTTSYDWGDYALASPYNGICQVCHTATSRMLASGTTWTNDSAHNTGQNCTTSCHKHDQPPADAFKADAGNCLGCHGTGTQGTTPVRRAVTADFSKNSHHVGAGSATMGGTLTNYDCIVCHAEGTATGKGGTISDTPLHMNKRIDLRDADSTTTYYQYDTDTIRALTAANASSLTASWKSEMSGRTDDLVGAPTVACNPTGTGCLKGLDRFCISCHDADGASQAQNVGEAGATNLNPFADGTITNEVDQMDRTRVVDVASRVHDTARTAAGGNATAANRDYTTATATGYTARRVDTGTIVNDPPEGVFSRHAIRGLTRSVYSATNANFDTTTYWTTTSWSSTSVMGCADCHTTDGNQSSATAASNYGNAHGSNTEYLLKRNDGTAASESNTSATYVCAKCHNATYYTGGSAKHTNNGSDWVDTTATTGPSRAGSSGNIWGMACGNCHGGQTNSKAGATYPAADVTGAGGWGTIHGTSQVIGYGSGGGTGYRPAYRFTNGNSMRYYDPGDWSTTATRSCYTLSTGDTWGNCTKHGSGVGNSIETGQQRPLDY